MKFVFICGLRLTRVMAALLFLFAVEKSPAAGTWTSLANTPPTGVNCCLLLSDGTVLTYDGNGNCNRLTPASNGSYQAGTWTSLAAMNNPRLFFASSLLTNGNVFVAGGEYGAGHDHAELFDPQNNVWTKIPDPVPGVGFSDAIGKILPSGNVFVAPVSQFGGCLIYNVASNKWQTAASAQNQNEVCWVKLPNDTIITIDTGAQTSEHYVPSSNQWITDGNVPVPVFGYGAEIGAGFLLPNGKVFYIGGTTNTAIYTSGATPTSAGSWAASSVIPNGLGAVDAPSAMMVNGKILCDLGPIGGFNGPCSFYEYDYTVDAFTAVGAPGGGSTFNSTPFANSMLDLPDGTVLFVGGQNSQSLYIYTPDGSPLAAGQPGISNIVQNVDGTYHLTGTNLNGICEGAAYGDDEQMDSNYPLVRLTNSVSGNVYYARTFNWNSTSVQTGSRLVATEFSLPQNLPAGNYSLVAVANGNASAPIAFSYAPPPVPTGLAADSGSNAFVNIRWNASAGATAYNVKRSLSSGGFFATIATVSGTSYTNSGVTNGVTYYYKVAAIGSGGASANSSAVSALPIGPPPVPVGLAATAGANGQVPLVWLLSYGATSYNLKRATVSGGPYTTIVTLNATNFTDTGLNNGTTYYYVISANGIYGESANSAQVSAIPATPVNAAWYKADAITTVANGGTVSTWVDSSGHGVFATQSTASQRPTFLTNTLNGLPVVRFNSAASTWLTFTRPVSDNFTVFCVFRSTQGIGSGTLYYQGAGLVNAEVSGSVNDFGSCLFANGTVCAGTGNPDVAVNSTTNFNDGNPHLMTFKRIKNTGEVDLYMDGYYAGTTTGNTNSLTAPSRIAIGAQQTAGNYLTGDIGEVKLYSAALSDLDRAAQEGALLSKWGISQPAAPAGLAAVAGNAQVQLSWNFFPGGTNFFVKRATVNGGPYTTIANSGFTNSFLDATVANGVTYYYVVSAQNAAGESANSAPVSAAPTAPAVAAWFKADAITGLVNGGTVASWTDSSGHGLAATQSTTSQRPTYMTNIVNGQPVVRFNSAANNSLNLTRPVQDDFTMLCVFRSTQGLNSGNLYWQGAGLVNGEVAGSVNDFGSCLFANGSVCAGTGNPDTAVTSASGFNDGNPHLMTFKRIKNSGEMDLYMDGIFSGTNYGNTNSLTAPSRLTLGAQQTGIYFLNGDIAEVKFFSSALSDFNRGIEENNLICKYGLPATTVILPTPANVASAGSNHLVSLSWLGVSGASIYTVSFATNAAGPFTPLANTTALTFQHTNAVVGATNFYRITAVNGCSTSFASATTSVFLPIPALALAAADASTLAISWPVWASDWNLYSTTNLLPPVVWALATNSVVSTNGQLTVFIPLGTDTKFFRLQSP